MKQIEIDAVEDRTRPEGGHAIVVLRGVSRLPDQAVFRLRPTDAGSHGAVPSAAFDGFHAPKAITLTSEGLALTIGPEIADSATLLPGTAMELVLPAAGLRGEFLWPTITPLARPKRRNIMTRKAAAGALPVSPMVAPAATGSAEANADRHMPPQAPTADIVAPPAAARPPQWRANNAAAAPRQALAPSPARDETAPDDHAPTLQHAAPERAIGQAGLEAKPVLSTPIGGTKQPRGITKGVLVTSALCLAALAVVVVAYREQAVGPSLRSPALSMTPAVAAGAKPESVAPARLGVFEALAVGATSPRGVAADSVSPAKALQWAHIRLHGAPDERDPQEAAFWLRRALRTTSGLDDTRLVLTQLGSAYAMPAGGTRDFVRARMVWEMAAALGDPVAACFLAATEEQGLGTAADPAAALLWYRRAEAAGRRCPSVPDLPAGATK